MRVEPLQITRARRALEKSGAIVKIEKHKTHWYTLRETPKKEVQERIDEQGAVFSRLGISAFTKRLGQTLEIAIFRSLSEAGVDFLGSFPDLAVHNDATLYSKEEPPSHIGKNAIPDKSKVDFLYRSNASGWAAIEAKNVREWQYPDRDEIRHLLRKAVHLDAVPVFIARRIPYVTFYLLSRCGVLFHQNYNQYFPTADAELANLAKNKHLLGYHDIRVGNCPDKRLQKFLVTNLPDLVERARPLFQGYKDLLSAFGNGDMQYKEFAARVRRRSNGTNEDRDDDEEDVEAED